MGPSIIEFFPSLVTTFLSSGALKNKSISSFDGSESLLECMFLRSYHVLAKLRFVLYIEFLDDYITNRGVIRQWCSTNDKSRIIESSEFINVLLAEYRY